MWLIFTFALHNFWIIDCRFGLCALGEAKDFYFCALAISFVGAAVIWRNIFAGGGIEPQEAINGVTPSYQIGLLKAL